MPAPVRVERRFEIAVLADFGEHLFHQRLPSLLLSLARGIELVEQIELFELRVKYRLLVRIIELASVHFFIPMVFLLFCFSPLWLYFMRPIFQPFLSKCAHVLRHSGFFVDFVCFKYYTL